MSNRNYEASLGASVTPTFEASRLLEGAQTKREKRQENLGPGSSHFRFQGGQPLPDLQRRARLVP